MRRSRRERAPWAAAALATGLALLGGRAGGPGAPVAEAQPQVPSFRGEVRVEEEAIVFQPPDPRFWRAGDLDAPDLLVAEGGRLRRVTRVEPLADSGRPWTQVVWIDRRLAAPETVFLATLALAKRAAALAALGAVEVVVADPLPRTALRPTREPRRIELVLADLAGAARVERDRAGDGRRILPPAELAAAGRRQADRLLVALADRGGRGPRAVFLIADTQAPAAAADLAPLLAGYGWVTVPLPLRRGEIDTPGQRPQRDAERNWRNSQEGWNDATVPPIRDPGFTVPPRRVPTVGALGLGAALYAMPDVAPLHELVVETAGHLVGYEDQLDPALAALGARWHVWLEVTPEPPGGRLRRLEIETVRGEPVRTFRWSRSATPPEVAAARLRLLLAGEGGREAGLPLRFAPNPEPALTVDLARWRPRGNPAAGPFRVSIAFAGPDGEPAIRHELLTAADLAARGWSYTTPLTPPPAAGRVAVVGEDLAAETWAGAAMALPAAPSGPP